MALDPTVLKKKMQNHKQKTNKSDRFDVIPIFYGKKIQTFTTK